MRYEKLLALRTIIFPHT